MDVIFQTTFSNAFSLNENVWISIEISLKFVPKGPIHDIPALVQVIIWTNFGYITDAYMQWIKLEHRRTIRSDGLIWCNYSYII